MEINQILAQEFHINHKDLQQTIALIEEGNTIPFIARYRKEATGGLDDQVLREIFERYQYLQNLKEKKDDVVRHITELELMTPEILTALEKAMTQTEVDDIYRPFRPKRRTRASVAKEKGLDPLAREIMSQTHTLNELETLAKPYIQEEKEIFTVQEALQGGMDILAEEIGENPNVRKSLRELLSRESEITGKGVDLESKSVYESYYAFSQDIKKLSGYQILALNRGEKEGFLKIKFKFDSEKVSSLVKNKYLKQGNPYPELMIEIIEDSLKRLLLPTLEREVRNQLTEKASLGAISLFGKNLQALLLQPPIKDHVTLGFDPAYRTGCKIAVVDQRGKLLDTTVIFPTPPQSKVKESEEILLSLIHKYKVTLIAVGNGTACKESEIFIANLIKHTLHPVQYLMANEAGASVYSASKLGAQEFPDLDVSKRSAISIARRIQDPLAELVKIDPKSIGVGQYQHDMPQKELEISLKGVVEYCVNTVGVDLNTASPSLLEQVAGINHTVSKNIVEYREQQGDFKHRKQLLKVPKLGPKAFLQSAGFLRISGGEQILDYTGVHPESYPVAEKLLTLSGFALKDLENPPSSLKEKLEKITTPETASSLEIGYPTLLDIKNELLKPGRDPRDEIPAPELRQDILDLKDLTIGTKLTGTVRNVMDFGAFVDIGVHVDGLVHLSKLKKSFVKHPLDVVKIGDIVSVTVTALDVEKKRISLSMIED